MPVLAGINCIFGALTFTLPSTTFAQNNGVIVLTRCASRSAGVACGCWLLLFGILSKVSLPAHACSWCLPTPLAGAWPVGKACECLLRLCLQHCCSMCKMTSKDGPP